MENHETRTVLHEKKINWYPGHMAKALREVQNRMKQVDLILEVRDARIPLTSGNANLQTIIGDKKRLILLNKADLAEEENLKAWEKWFKEQGEDFIILSADNKKSVKRVFEKTDEMMKERIEKYKKKGIRPPTMRMMVVGVPNTGKSTIINRLAGKNKVQAGNKPGVTRHQAWIVVGKEKELLDTPGIMQPKIDTDIQGLWLCSIFAIKDEIPGRWRVASFLLDNYQNTNPEPFYKHFKLSAELKGETEIFEQIGRNFNLLKTGGEIDLEQVYRKIIHDFREGLLGAKSFELPPVEAAEELK